MRSVVLVLLVAGWQLMTGCAARPDSGQLLELRQQAFTAYEDGNYQEALIGFEQLVDKLPTDGEAWFRLGNCYGRLNRQEEAAAAYRNSLLRQPDNGKAWYNLGLVQLQAALKTYVEMARHVGPDDPAFAAGGDKRKQLFELLGSGVSTGRGSGARESSDSNEDRE